MRWQSLISLVLTISGGSLNGLAQTAPAPGPEAPAATSSADRDASSQLSPPVLSVVKLINAGASEDVINGYIENNPAPFNLTANDILRLDRLGVPASLTVAMLNHDKAFWENPGSAAPPDASADQAPPAGAAAPPSGEDLYSNLEPYGSWNDMPGYGYYWQPYGSLAYDSYPWGSLGFGFWRNVPGHGWCWFPHSHFHSFNHFEFHNGGQSGFHAHSGFQAGVPNSGFQERMPHSGFHQGGSGGSHGGGGGHR